MRKQIVLQLKSVNRLKVFFALKKCYADNKFLEYSGAHAIGYFHCVGFEFLSSDKYRFAQGSSSLKSVNATEMPASYHRNADEMLFKTDNVCQKVDAKKQMLNTVCQNTCQKSNAKEM